MDFEKEKKTEESPHTQKKYQPLNHMNGVYEDQPPPVPESCTNRLCVQFRLQHRNMTHKRNELEKELDHARKQHDALFNQVVTRGEASMMREAATGENGVRLPNGEVMTAEKYIAKTKMMNQCMESLQASEKKARALAEENTRLKQERDSLYTNMRKYENMLHGFEKPRQFEAYTQETHKQTVQENHEMVERLKKLSRSEREARDEIDAMRCRIQAYKKKESIARINGSASPVTNAASIPRKKSRVEDV
jgi:hypothetical protein